ncbi:MAG TPA: asparagine synthase C-terminal domain-containing protein, partial [Metalysinibacillus sp.]
YDTLKGEDDTTKKQVLDFHLWMVDDILLKADKMTMAHSLEVRTPLLDGELLKVAERLPLEYRVNEIDTKYAFREASRHALPEEWVKRKKLGFPVPIRVWLQEEAFFTTVKKAFESEYAAQFFDQNKIMKLLVDHYKGVAQNQRKIWSVYMFLVWYEQYFLKN